ncbi:MAG: HD domain-containing phosphohydrolase [Bryobacteraceae bacterium]|jgi:HD-GYP domain-containing protein (c-di-GMP phosphodiesterase class II)
MRFRTRAFLLCFIPFALLLAGSFWATQKLVQTTVQDGLRSSLRENQLSIARLRSRTDLQNSRFLRVVGENAALKAGLQLLQSNPTSPSAKETVEDQLRELCVQMGFDYLAVSDPEGTALAAVIRTDAGVTPLSPLPERSTQRGLTMQGDTVYQIASVPIDQAEENIAELSVGERFNLSEFNTPAVLLGEGKVLKSSIPGIPLSEIETALKACHSQDECDVRLGGQGYMSLPLQISFGDGYAVRSLQNVDAASGPVQSVLNRLFLSASIGVILVALLFSVLSSQNIVEPITAMISHLQRSESTGLLPEFTGDLSPIREIRELTSSFNRAAGAIREARQSLQRAYLEFVGSLASALDARDRYTSGHSGRVSELSCATAMALGVSGDELNDIRIGALLHDIGKIGISDIVLQKPGKLTAEEFAIVKQHPEIGRRILEGVQGFAAYLPAVELHHENWDGTGYPRGESGETTPLAARIIHVSDAYDAMTTDRPYRDGMTHDEAIAILRRFAGSQFDPRVVDAFVKIAAGFESPDRKGLRALEYAIAGKT